MNPEIVCDIFLGHYTLMVVYVRMSGVQDEVYMNPITNIEHYLHQGHSIYLTLTQVEKASVQHRFPLVHVC